MNEKFEDWKDSLAEDEARVANAKALLIMACNSIVEMCCPYSIGDTVPVKNNWSYAGRHIVIESIDLQRSKRLHGGAWLWIITGRLKSKVNNEILNTTTVSFVKAGDEDVTDGEESGKLAAAGV